MLRQRLVQTLESAFRDFHAAEFLPTDPLQCVHSAPRPVDREITALLAALLAYGNVKTILGSVNRVLQILEMFGGPHEVVQNWSQVGGDVERQLKRFVHRFTTGRDLVCLLAACAASVQKYGSVGAHFAQGLTPGDSTIEMALTTLISDWRSESFDGRKNFLLTSPADGSCCKRWCMLLRWMGRRDAVDPGLWQDFGLKSSQLVMPLDTHTARLTRALGLTSSKTPSWSVALEVTEKLRAIDPKDPTRFDFALCRIGMLRRDLSSAKGLGNVWEGIPL